MWRCGGHVSPVPGCGEWEHEQEDLPDHEAIAEAHQAPSLSKLPGSKAWREIANLFSVACSANIGCMEKCLATLWREGSCECSCVPDRLPAPRDGRHCHGSSSFHDYNYKYLVWKEIFAYEIYRLEWLIALCHILEAAPSCRDNCMRRVPSHARSKRWNPY